MTAREPLPNVQTQKIPVTLAERPHPFPSRTRKLSSPAPKILRGQPFGKIGRRRDFCVPAHFSISPPCRLIGPVPAILDAMTALEPQVRNLPTAVPAGSVTGRPVTRICPYLSAADGAWRSTTVAREHRCGAVAPPAPLATEKQRRLCLTPDYATCATFEAARAARPIGPDRAPTLPRPMARTTPVV